MLPSIIASLADENAVYDWNGTSYVANTAAGAYPKTLANGLLLGFRVKPNDVGPTDQELAIDQLEALASKTVNQSVTVAEASMLAASRRITIAGIGELNTWTATVADEAEIDAIWNDGAGTIDFTDGVTTVSVTTEPISLENNALSADPDWANDPTLVSDRSTTTAEMDRRDALQVNVADRVGTIRDAANAESTKWADELAIRNALDAMAPLDEDDFASDSDTRSTTQQSAKSYADRRDSFLSSVGWVKQSGTLAEAGSKRFSIGALNLVRWDDATNEAQTFSYAAANPISFRVANQAGYVDTGLGGEDLTAPVDQIQQSWGYDNGGTLADITAVAADTNDGVIYRVYVIPQTGEFIVLLPQSVVNTVTNAFYRFGDESVTLPAILNGSIFLGFASLDEDAANFSFSTFEGRFPGQTTSSSATTETAYQYAADPTTLTPAQLTENGIVGTGGGLSYREYRILTIGTNWTTTVKELIWSKGTAENLDPNNIDYQIGQAWSGQDLFSAFGSPWLMSPGDGVEHPLSPSQYTRYRLGGNNATLPEPGAHDGKTIQFWNNVAGESGIHSGISGALFSPKVKSEIGNIELPPGTMVTLISDDGRWNMAIERDTNYYYFTGADNDGMTLPTGHRMMIHNDTAGAKFKLTQIPVDGLAITMSPTSTEPFDIEQAIPGAAAQVRTVDGDVESVTIGLEIRGKTIEINGNNTFWNFGALGAGATDEPIIALAADNKPVAYKARQVTADTTLDWADVPATAGISYYIELAPSTEETPVVLDAGLPSAITHTGPNFELLHFVSTGTEGEVRLEGNETITSGEFYREFALNGTTVSWTVPHTGEFVINENLTTATNNAVITTITNTTAGGTTYTSNDSQDRLTSTNLENTATVALTAGDVLSIDALSAGGTTSGAHTVRIRPVGGIIQPTNEPAWTPRTLAITIDGVASVPQTIYDDAGRWVYIDAGTDRRFVEKGDVSGAAWATSGTGTLSQDGQLFIQAAGDNVSLTLTTEAVPVEVLPTSFSGWFSLTSANHYFTPTVSGNYKLRETLQNATNNALLTTIRRKSNGSQVYTSNLNRITNSNQVNTATIALLANVTYEIDPASGGGTSVGSHSLTLILDS